MTTDYRALCAELVDDLSEWVDGYLVNDPADEFTAASSDLIDRARTALAESIDCVACEDRPAPGNSPCFLCGRTAQPQPPAGEVGELVAWLRDHELDELSNYDWEALRTRAADLLKQLAQDHSADTSKMVEPTDEELLELWKGWNLGWDPQKGTVLMPHPAEYARAVLARFGNRQ
jgi:hypothetical protein